MPREPPVIVGRLVDLPKQRHHNKQVPAGPSHARNLAQNLCRFADMLQRHDTDGRIEGRVGKRQRRQIRQRIEATVIPVCAAHAQICRNVPVPCEPWRVLPFACARVKDTRALAQFAGEPSHGVFDQSLEVEYQSLQFSTSASTITDAPQPNADSSAANGRAIASKAA